MLLLLIPDSDAERNSIEAIGIPKMVSFLAFHDPNSRDQGTQGFPAGSAAACVRRPS